MSLTIGGGGDEWKLFGRKGQTGSDILFRSRTQVPSVRDYAQANPMVRLRFATAGTRGDFEQSLLRALERANAEAYLLATITSDGNRDLFFAARDTKQLRDAIDAADNPEKVVIQFAPIPDADRPKFIKLLTLTPEMEKAAFAQGNARAMPFGRPQH